MKSSGKKKTLVLKGDLIQDYRGVAQVIPVGYLTCPKAKEKERFMVQEQSDG